MTRLIWLLLTLLFSLSGSVIGELSDFERSSLAAKSEGPFVYRGLAKGEDPTAGLTARAPGAGNSEISHFAGKKQSQWISTTMDEATAVGKCGEHGAVRIDLGKVPSNVSDVSGGFPNGGRMSNWERGQPFNIDITK